MRHAWLILVVASFAVPAGARPQQDEREADRFLGGRKAVKRGSLKDMKAHQVPIGGRRTAEAGALAERLFADHLEFAREARKARAALLADPTDEDEVVETEHSTVLTTSTSMVVVDPNAMRRSSPGFAKARGAKAAAMKFADLTKEARADFEEYRRKAAGFAENHPLRQAAAGGDQALLDAIAAGQGDFRVTTTIVVPKHELPFDDAGKAVAPKGSREGSFDYEAPKGKSKKREPGRAEREIGPDPKSKERKKDTFKARFLLGDTVGDSWTWSRRWNVPTGFFQITAKAWYAYGLRIPVEVTGTIEPALIQTTGANDVASDYGITLSARAFDAGADFYESTGLAAGEVHEGKELVLEAGFSVTFRLKVAGVNIDKSIPGDDGFDFGKHFAPPFGGGGGFEVWVPAEITRTQVGILGIIKGSAQVGVNVTGEGTFQAACAAVCGNDDVKSWTPGDKNNARKSHALAFANASTERKLTAELEPLDRSGASTMFGCRMSAPEYHWDLRLVPGVRVDVSVGVKWVFSESFTIKLFLDDLAIDLGTLKLRAHPGTTAVYRVKTGEKTFEKK